MEKLAEFQGEPVKFVETIVVKEGVSCDVYEYTDSKEKDLAVVTVQPGASTPLQKVLQGDKTIEGYLSGAGKLVLDKKEYLAPGDLGEINVSIGSLMQWTASDVEGLIFYEICHPPYQDGRYENLPE